MPFYVAAGAPSTAGTLKPIAFCGARSEPNGVHGRHDGVHLLSSDAEPGARPEKPVPRLSKKMRREKEAKRP